MMMMTAVRWFCGFYALRSVLVAASLLVAMAVIFIFDTVTDYAIAAAVFYTTVILVAVRLSTRRAVIVLTLGCIAMTAISFGLTRSGAYEVGLINTMISITAIGVTAYLALKLASAEALAHEARERLLRIARINTLGQLTTSIAHEVSQPMAALSINASACRRWLEQQPPNAEKAKEAVERIIENVERAREILERVRRLAKGETTRKSLFDFNEAVIEIAALSRNEIVRRRVNLDMTLEEGLPFVLADRVQTQQVIGNLILNAIEAMGKNAAAERRLTISSSRFGPDAILCAISDTGPGLSPVARERLFDAFWTTKKNGFGLGLTICRAIVEANGGHIRGLPNPKGGSIFQFDLPIEKGAEK